MRNPSAPAVRAEHVGTFLRPQALLEARAQFAANKITREQPRATEVWNL